MEKRTIFVFILLTSLSLTIAKDFIEGTKVNNLLVSTEKFVFRSIPFFKRDKDYTYADPKQRIIKGILARDLDRSDAEVSIVSGGIGKTSSELIKLPGHASNDALRQFNVTEDPGLKKERAKAEKRTGIDSRTASYMI